MIDGSPRNSQQVPDGAAYHRSLLSGLPQRMPLRLRRRLATLSLFVAPAARPSPHRMQDTNGRLSSPVARGATHLANTDGTLSFRFFALPQWLPFSGLPAVLGASWPVFQALAMLDHRCEGSPTHRPNPENRPEFAVPMVDVCMMSGCSRQRVYEQMQRFSQGSRLLAYTPGEKTKHTWPRFEVNRQLLGEVYLRVAPLLRQIHGGLQDCTTVPDGQAWYGFNAPHARSLTRQQATIIRQARRRSPKDPDRDQIAEIVGWTRTAGGVYAPVDALSADVPERDNGCLETRPRDVSQ